MFKIQPIKQFGGFGPGGLPDEYFYSQGMTRSRNGMVPGWKTTAAIDNSTLASLTLMNWFAQSNGIGGSTYVYGIGTDGKIYQSLNGTGTWTLAYTPFNTVHGNGLFGGPDGYLYFLSENHLGRYDGVNPTYTTGTIAVTNGSPNVVGTGTSWGPGIAGSKITISGVDYFVQTYVDPTHLTLSGNYAGSTTSGLSYTLYLGWKETYKAISSHLTSTSKLRGVDCFEDLIIFSNGYTFGTYNITTATINSDSFTLPQNFDTVIARPGETGILCAANMGNKGIVFLWDGNSDRSISKWIWYNENIKAVVPWSGVWLVITTKKIYLTNGYTSKVFLPKFFDSKVSQSIITANLLPSGADVVDDRLIFMGTTEGLNRQKSGIYILDLNTKLFEFAPIATGQLINIQSGALFFDGGFRTHVSYKTTLPNKTVLGYLSNAAPATSFVIHEGGPGATRKTAEGVKPQISIDTKEYDRRPITFDVTVKVAPDTQTLFAYGQTNGASTQADILKVDGTASGFNNADVGDEVTILEGVNAGQIRHITAISNPNTNTETWTLDSVLPSNTESTVRISVSPFKITKKSPHANAAELRNLYFEVTKKLQGKKYYIKTLFENVGSTIPELNENDFIFNDLGEK